MSTPKPWFLRHFWPIYAWASIGMLVTSLKLVTSGSVAWWLIVAPPIIWGLGVVGFVFVVSVLGAAIGFLAPRR